MADDVNVRRDAGAGSFGNHLVLVPAHKLTCPGDCVILRDRKCIFYRSTVLI